MKTSRSHIGANSCRYFFGSPIKEWKLVYAPKNVHLDKLMDWITKKHGLNGFEGVANGMEIESVMLNRELIAGIQFNHLDVGYNVFLRA